MCDSRLSADDAHEQTSRMSSLDLYEDLLITEDNENGDRVLSMPEILSDKHSLQEQNALLLRQLMESKLEAQKLEEEKVNLQNNFNNLLATAKVELERKNGLLSRYVGGSGAPITRPTSAASSHISKEHARPSSKKKGLLELYKGRRVNENELTALSMSSGPVMPHTTVSSTTLLQHRGEKMVGVATRVIGSSFKNITTATSNTSINLSRNQQANARMLDSEGQNTQPKGRMPNPIEELVQVSSNARHSANDIFRSISPKSRHPSSKLEKRESRFRVERSREINELELYPNNLGRIRPNDISTASSSEVMVLSTSEDTNGRMNTTADIAPKLRNVNEARTTTPKSSDVRLTRGDSSTITDRDRIRHSSKSRIDITTSSSKRAVDKATTYRSSSSVKDSKFFESDNQKDERTSFKEGTPRNRTSTTRNTLDREKTRPYDEGRRSIDPREAMYSGSSAVSWHSEKDRERRHSERRTSKRESQSKDPFGKTELSQRYNSKNRIVEKRPHRKTEERERCSSVNEKPYDQKKRTERSSGDGQKMKSEKMKKSSDLREKTDEKYQVGPRKSPRKAKMDAARSMNRDGKSMPKDDPLQSKKSSSNPDHPKMKRQSFKDASIGGPSTCSTVGFGLHAQISSTEPQSSTHLNSTLESSASRIIGSTELLEKPKLKKHTPDQVKNFDCISSATGVNVVTKRCETSLDSHPSLYKSNFAPTVKSKAQNPMNKAPQRKSPRKATPTKKNMSNKAAPSIPLTSADVGNLLVHSQSAAQIPEAAEYMGSPHLELDYNEDSLMYREIMQPDNANETNMPSDNTNDQSRKENSAFEADKNDAASCGINQRSPVSDAGESIASSNLQISGYYSISVPGRKPNMPEPQSTTISESVDKDRLKETSNSEYRTSANISKLSQLASSPKYQPHVRLVDIKQSAVDKGVKRRIFYETEGEVPVKRSKILSGTDKPGKEKVYQFGPASKTPSDPRQINLKANTDPRKAETLPSAVRQQDGLCRVLPPDLKIHSSSNLGSEGTAGGPEVSSRTPASTTLMDIGMEVEVETSPSVIFETKKKPKKKLKKHKLKIKIKPFKRNKGRKDQSGDTNFGKSLGDIETACVVSSACDPSDVLPGSSAVRHLPEASPVLSQWLDSAKKKKKKHERKDKDRKQKSKKSIHNSEEKSVDIESTCNASKTKDKTSEALPDNSRTKGEQDELANAVASICGEGETTSVKHKNSVPLVFKSVFSPQKNRTGNSMRSYSNAALKWLIHLGSERLKILNGTTMQPLDLSREKWQRPASIQSVTKGEHPTAVANLFSEEPGNETKSPPIDEITAAHARYSLVGTSTSSTVSRSSTGNKALGLSQPGSTLDPTTPQMPRRLLDADCINEMQCHHGTSTLSSTVEGNGENFDDLLEKHAEKQKERLKFKDEADKTQQPPVKRRKSRRVTLERVEMPDPKLLASQRNDMVSPLSRSLWMTSLEKCQERRKKRSRWSSEVREYDEAQESSGLDEYDKVASETEKIPENAADTTLKVPHIEPVLPDSVPAFQNDIQPSRQLHKSCRLPDHSDAASSSSHFSVGDMSSSSWRLSEESRCRLYLFAKAVQVLSPLKSSPSILSLSSPRVHFKKKDVKRRVLKSP